MVFSSNTVYKYSTNLFRYKNLNFAKFYVMKISWILYLLLINPFSKIINKIWTRTLFEFDNMFFSFSKMYYEMMKVQIYIYHYNNSIQITQKVMYIYNVLKICFITILYCMII